MLELHVLGTSSARFSHQRAVSGSLVRTPAGSLLVDCGEGMQQRLMDHNRSLKQSGLQSRSRMAKMKAILLTHGHLDHCWGLLPMLQTLALDGRVEPLTIIGPTTSDALEWATRHPGETPPVESGICSTDLAILFSQWQTLGSKDEEFGYPIDWVLLTIEDGTPFSSPVQPLDGVELVVIPTIHSAPSCAWMVRVPAPAGKFDRQRADAAGLSTEQISLLAGGEDIEVAGELLAAADFRGPPRPPRSLCISGDTSGGVAAFGKLPSPPDLLMHESTFTVGKQEMARKYFHSTSEDAARHAQKSGTNLLVLTHYSSRINDPSEVEREAAAIHPNCVAARDGDLFVVQKSGIITLHRRSEGWQQTTF